MRLIKKCFTHPIHFLLTSITSPASFQDRVIDLMYLLDLLDHLCNYMGIFTFSLILYNFISHICIYIVHICIYIDICGVNLQTLSEIQLVDSHMFIFPYLSSNFHASKMGQHPEEFCSPRFSWPQIQFRDGHIIYDGWDIVLDNSSDLSYALQSYLNCRGYLWGKHGAAFAEEQYPIIILLSILVFHHFWYTSFVNLQTKCVMFESKVVRKSFNTATNKC